NGAPASPTCLELASRAPSWQRSCATASTDRTYDRNRFDPTLFISCRPGAVHIWVPDRLAWRCAPRAVRDDIRVAGGAMATTFILQEHRIVDITLIGQHVMNGLMLGVMYGLVAVGFTLFFGVLDVIKFSHGDVLTVGAFTALATYLAL